MTQLIGTSKSKTATARSGRLGLRTAPEQEQLLRRAAQVANKTLTEFILDGACRLAEQTLLDQRYFLLDEQQWQAFNDMLDRPAQDKPALQALLAQKAPWDA